MVRRHTRKITSFFVFVIISTIIFGIGNDAGKASSAARELIHFEENGGGEVSSNTDSIEWLSATRQWTNERMLNAQPMPINKNIGGLPRSIEVPESNGRPGFIQSNYPEGKISEFSLLYLEDLFNVSTPLDYTYPPPYTRYRNFDSYTEFPYSTIGVLFFSQYDIDYRCSAASIGGKAIWTAGHCIHSGDDSPEGWSEDVIFVPAYKDGDAPFGFWFAENLWTKGNWYSSKDLRYDMGGAVLYNNPSGKKISQVVGNLGFSYNLSPVQHWYSIGYPSLATFDGKWQYICSASYAYSDTSMGDPNPIAMGCDMTPGSSGGPWIKNFDNVAGSANYLNGNNSYRYTGFSEEMYSPYFGHAAKTLYNTLLGIQELDFYIPIVINE